MNYKSSPFPLHPSLPKLFSNIIFLGLEVLFDTTIDQFYSAMSVLFPDFAYTPFHRFRYASSENLQLDEKGQKSVKRHISQNCSSMQSAPRNYGTPPVL